LLSTYIKTVFSQYLVPMLFYCKLINVHDYLWMMLWWWFCNGSSAYQCSQDRLWKFIVAHLILVHNHHSIVPITLNGVFYYFKKHKLQTEFIEHTFELHSFVILRTCWFSICILFYFCEELIKYRFYQS